MSEKLAEKSGNGVEKEPVINASTPGETGVVDEIERVIERGEAKSISLENIEKGLTALWQAAAKPRPGEEEQPVMRACVFNLVICVEGEDALAEVSETIAQLTWNYPCRAIVLVRKPDEPESSINAFISAHCQLPSATGKKVCCEQITIIGSGSSSEGLWSLVLPLLVSDLPVILYWPGEPGMDSNLFCRLMEPTDRLIVDSQTFENPSASFAHLAELSQGEYAGTPISDLNWARLTPWRNLIAEIFDAPQFLPYLSQIDSLELDYEAPDDNKNPNFSEALLLVGWLATTLGWQPAFSLQRKGSNASLILNQHGAPLTVQIRGHNDRIDELGGVTQVKLTASKPGNSPEETRSASFSISLNEDYKHALMLIEEEGSQPIRRNVMFHQRSRTELLTEDLAIVRRDHIFEASLELAGGFCR